MASNDSSNQIQSTINNKNIDIKTSSKHKIMKNASKKSKLKKSKKAKHYSTDESFIGNIIPLSEDFFEENIFNLYSNDTNKFDEWINNIKLIVKENKNKFKILHLNINSVFNKIQHILSLLNEIDIDIISINESKLDENTSDTFIEHPKYNTIRRDRVRNGGGRY